MERLLPTLRWGALSTALYWVYVFAAVPWIEPQIDLAALSDSGPSSIESGVPLLRKRLRTWFAEDAWEVNEASKILETSQGIIVLRNYQNLPDGTVRLWPCSFVLFPNRPDVALERMEHEAIVLQATQGAILRFDTPLDLRRARLGRLLGGKLVGPVAVRSGGRSPGPEDDLYIAAVDVDLSDDVLRSPGDVTFRWGRNQGRGQGLQVDMVMRNGADGAPSFDGIKALTLQERVWMELHLGDKLLRDSTPSPDGPKAGPGLPGTAGPAIKPAAYKPSAAPITAEPPIHAQSRGPFRFDLVDRQVKFRDDVVLSRPMPAGGTEQLACDDLLLLFDVDDSPAHGSPVPGSPPPAATASDEAATAVDPRQLKRMAFRELQAVGKAVKLISPSRQLEVACGLLQWNDKTGWLSLGRRPPTAAERDATAVAADADARPVTVRQAGNELEAPEIHLQFDRGARQLNRAVATGPGKLVAKPGKQAFAAVWRNRMEVVPEGNLHVVHLIGGASIDGEGTGDLTADLIRLWLFDASKPPEPVARLPVPRRAQNQWQPHHLEAIDRVAVRSSVVVGKLNRLELWFEHFAEEAPAPPGQAEPESEDELVPPLAAGGLPGSGPRATSAAFGSPESLPAAPGKSRRFTLQGDRFWGRIGIYAGKPKLIEGRGEGGIDLVEDAPQTAGSSTGMSGDAVQVLQDPLAGEVVTLVGKPARVRTESLSLEGDAIHFGRTKSELWVNGPGLLQMKLQGLVTENGPAAAAVRSPLEVRWKGGLHFDGLAARFETDVKAQWDGRALRTERLDVLLTERLDLSDGQAGNRTRSTVAKIHCPKDFFLESRAFGQGRPASVERMQARDLTIEAGTGFVVAQGPGWVVQLRPGRSAFDGNDGAATGERQVLPGGRTVPVSPAPVGRSMLQYLQVTFQEELSGNFRQGHLRFHGRVETVYGPVEDWDDAVDPDRLGPQAFWMRCDLLGVRQVRIGEEKPTHELDALDDVQLEGREFSGAAARLSYNQAKDLLILEGDGRADARLIRQAAPGAGTSRFAARKILFWRTLDRVKVEDGRQVDVDTATPPPTR